MPIRDEIVAYLQKEKECILQEQEANEKLTDVEKIDKGLLIRNATLTEFDAEKRQAFITCPENNSKFRTGDRVDIVIDGQRMDALVVENGLEEITLQVGNDVTLQDGANLSVEAKGMCMVDSILALMDNIVPGAPGYSFLCQIEGIQPVVGERARQRQERIDRVIHEAHGMSAYDAAVHIANAMPSFFCIQGPPGSGKTTLLAKIAANLNANGNSILIIANTHQAVNNALNAIVQANSNMFVAKIGHWLKRDKLDHRVGHFKSLYGCMEYLRKTYGKHPPAQIIGMTFLSAVIEVGLQNTRFAPTGVLVDEASQIPLPYAAVIGGFGASSTIFFGDEMQMPPIFHNEQKRDPLSVSVFEHLKKKYPQLAITLDKTYRMNDEICALIQRHFYPEVNLNPDVSAKDRRLSAELSGKSQHLCPAIRQIFNDDKSVQILISDLADQTDENPQEADWAKEIVLEAFRLLQDQPGVNKKERVAVITPFRRQARLIKGMLRNAGVLTNEMPLVDTVERLQGQTVDIIVLSFCSSDLEYICDNASFLFDVRRTNVMISRAKTKVVIMASEHLIGMNPNTPVGTLLQRIRSRG